ncbi:MAG: TetR/AcrR family transcriptional regulator [Anaerolineae bacterium]|nr:TetR/AcrR family transcriptional regulator [Anaerolineae bacterium]
MSKETFKERARRRREDEIVAAAEALLAERGYANLNMDDLADVVGISKPTLYQHFRSKEDLAAEVFIRVLRGTEAFLTEPLTGPAIERIIALIRWTVTQRRAAGNMVAGMRPDMLWTVVRARPEVEEQRQRVHRHIITLIEQARAEGSIAPDMPTALVLHSLLSLQWLLHNPHIRAEVEANPAGLDGVMASIERLFLHGVTPGKAECDE